jgi:hypothetical protein
MKINDGLRDDETRLSDRARFLIVSVPVSPSQAVGPAKRVFADTSSNTQSVRVRRSIYVFEKIGSATWTRTKDLAVNSRLLYQLSYRGRPDGLRKGAVRLAGLPGFAKPQFAALGGCFGWGAGAGRQSPGNAARRHSGARFGSGAKRQSDEILRSIDVAEGVPAVGDRPGQALCPDRGREAFEAPRRGPVAQSFR